MSLSLIVYAGAFTSTLDETDHIYKPAELSGPSKNPKLRLTGIPRELRLRIFSYVLTCEKTVELISSVFNHYACTTLGSIRQSITVTNFALVEVIVQCESDLEHQKNVLCENFIGLRDEIRLDFYENN
jgi:hypothetical protein